MRHLSSIHRFRQPNVEENDLRIGWAAALRAEVHLWLNFVTVRRRTIARLSAASVKVVTTQNVSEQQVRQRWGMTEGPAAADSKVRGNRTTANTHPRLTQASTLPPCISTRLFPEIETVRGRADPSDPVLAGQINRSGKRR